jgi:predicted Zn-dependent peptidase
MFSFFIVPCRTSFAVAADMTDENVKILLKSLFATLPNSHKTKSKVRAE